MSNRRYVSLAAIAVSLSLATISEMSSAGAHIIISSFCLHVAHIPLQVIYVLCCSE